MNRHRHFTVFLILLLLVSTFVAVSHHHYTRYVDHDCPLCLAGYQQHATNQSTDVSDGIPFITKANAVTPDPNIIEKIFIAFPKTRAPPA